MTFKSLIRPLIDYCCPVWYPNASKTSIKRLQAIQNAALRIVTGCHLKSPISHLHSETQVLPVDKHLELLSAQYLANALRPIHPSHAVVSAPQGPRAMKFTLFSKTIHLVEPHLQDGIIPTANYNKVVSSLHLAAVASTVCEAGENDVLGLYPPVVAKSEESLSRAHRCTLAQLRSGYCVRLKSYLFSVGKADSNLCPECGTASQTPNHLFDCPSFPTDLTVRDLWTNPRETAIFISSLPSFIHHLPPVPPLPSPIPPQHPP